MKKGLELYSESLFLEGGEGKCCKSPKIDLEVFNPNHSTITQMDQWWFGSIIYVVDIPKVHSTPIIASKSLNMRGILYEGGVSTCIK
jgi:hypothetical protein